MNFGNDDNYVKELIPEGVVSGDPVYVYINVSVLAFPAIETVNLKFTADFYLQLRWFETRIDYQDLNNLTSLNSLSKVDIESIWTPRLAFINALGPVQTIVDELSEGLLRREGNPLPEDPYQSTEGNV